MPNVANIMQATMPRRHAFRLHKTPRREALNLCHPFFWPQDPPGVVSSSPVWGARPREENDPRDRSSPPPAATDVVSSPAVNIFGSFSIRRVFVVVSFAETPCYDALLIRKEDRYFDLLQPIIGEYFVNESPVIIKW